GQDVVEGQVGGLAAAVLAGVAVPGEDLATGQLEAPGRPRGAGGPAATRGRGRGTRCCSRITDGAWNSCVTVRMTWWPYSRISALSPKTSRNARGRFVTFRGS